MLRLGSSSSAGLRASTRCLVLQRCQRAIMPPSGVIAAFGASSASSSTWLAEGSQEDFMKRDNCILVDDNDNVIGGANKHDAHRFTPATPQGLLHRAFSVFLFDSTGRLILQQRAEHKITFPGVWTNTCCSHQLSGQRPDELDTPAAVADGSVPGAKAAALRKLAHELGVPQGSLRIEDLRYVTRLHYCAPHVLPDGSHSGWGEHEIDYILLAQADVPLQPNPDEVAAVKAVTLPELQAMMAPGSGLSWSPWFRIIAQHLLPAWWEALPEVLAGRSGRELSVIHRINC